MTFIYLCRGWGLLISLSHLIYIYMGEVWGISLRRWPPLTMHAGHLISSSTITEDVWKSRLFEFCAACWAHFMCHQELWPTSVSHPFSLLRPCRMNALAAELLSLSLDLIVNMFALPRCLLSVSFYHHLSVYFLLAGLVLQYMALLQSGD